MKKTAILLLAAFLTTASVPVLAQEVKSEKDECLLISKGCKNEVDSLQQRIKKLQAEIKKGKKVYSADDLKKLEAKLKDANDTLQNILKEPTGPLNR